MIVPCYEFEVILNGHSKSHTTHTHTHTYLFNIIIIRSLSHTHTQRPFQDYSMTQVKVRYIWKAG